MKYRIGLAVIFLTGLFLIERNYFIQGSGLAVLGFVLVELAVVLIAFLLYSKISLRSDKSRKNGSIVIVLIVAMNAFLVLGNFIYGRLRANQLATEGKQLTAKIDSINYETRGDIDAHFIYYRYNVDKIDFAYSHQIDSSEFHALDTLTIRYLPGRPEFHEIIGTINESGRLSKKK